MDVVTLPLVWSSAPVQQALDVMKDYRRAGVVVERTPDAYRLLFAGNLLQARADGIGTVGNVPGGEDVVLVDPVLAGSFSADLVRPSRSGAAYEHMLDASGSQYGLIGESPRDVMLVTRHESLGAMLTLTGGCECTGSPTHYFPPPQATIGQRCPRYPACAVPGQPPSTVRPV